MNITMKTWNKPQSLLGRGSDFSQSGILDAHRFFYLFFSNNDIDDYKNNRMDPKAQYIGKAIQLNLSISKGGKENIDVVPWVRGSDNSTYMNICMYVYDVICEGSITNLNNAEFILKDSLVSSTVNDYDIHKAMNIGTSMYSKDLRDKPDKMSMLAGNIMACTPNIPEPEFYTMRQQEIENNDIYCITSLGTIISKRGVDLFDENTTFSIMDLTEMNSLEPTIRHKLYEVRNTNRMKDYKALIYDSTELSEYTLYQDFVSMQHGYTYIYDTNMGVNIIKNKCSYMPFANHQFKDKLQEDLESTLRLIRTYAQCVEKDLGPLRLMFTPLYYGDKSNVYFKDWNPDNQPVIKGNMGLDNGTKLENEINECCSEMGIDDDYPPEGDMEHSFDDML